MRTVLAAALLSCAFAVRAQPDKMSAPGQGSQPADHNSSPSPDQSKLRVKFDQDSAKGEITCGNVQAKDGSTAYQCRKLNVDKYKDVAVAKKLVSADQYEALEEKYKAMAKKLAFLDSANEELKKKLEAVKDKQQSADYKKLADAKKKIGSEYKTLCRACARQAADKLSCPTPPADRD